MLVALAEITGKARFFLFRWVKLIISLTKNPDDSSAGYAESKKQKKNIAVKIRDTCAVNTCF